MSLRFAALLDAGIGCSRPIARAPLRLGAVKQATTPLRLPPLCFAPRRFLSSRPAPLPPLRTFLSRKPPLSPFSARRFFSSSPSRFLATHRSRYNGSSYGRGGSGSGQFWSRLKRRLDRLNDNTIIFGLIGVNIAVFGLWQYGVSSAQRFHDPSVYMAMLKNFVVSWPNVMSGRLWTLVTTCFSQSSPAHLLNNCLGLYFVSGAALSVLGGFGFLSLYLAGGVAASLASLGWQAVQRNPNNRGSQGASGAIYATLSFFAMVFPQSQILLFFVIPMPAWVAVAGFMAWDTYSAILRPSSTTDSAGHIGGLLFGLAAAAAFRRGRLPRIFVRQGWY